MQSHRFRAALVLMLALTVGCAKAPPTLTPEATRAFYGTQVIHDLDRLREVAVAAHATTPPLVSAEDTLEIVKWHESAIVTVHAGAAGWKAAVATGLDQALGRISAAARQLVAPYVAIVKALLEVS